jgi:hypothetical protein
MRYVLTTFRSKHPTPIYFPAFSHFLTRPQLLIRP